MPLQSFKRINAQRSALLVDDDEAMLMLSCALSYSSAESSDVVQHWLRRVRKPSSKVQVLLDALFDSRAEVRRRAAHYLDEFDVAEVQDRLHLVALRDPDATVRAAAVDSLGGRASAELKVSLLSETQDPNSPYRLQAIEALRSVPDDDTVDRLVQIVGGDGVGHDLDARILAIDVLGSYGTPRAVKALVDIALFDRDREDRDAAVHAIGRLGRATLPALRSTRCATRARVPTSFMHPPCLRSRSWEPYSQSWHSVPSWRTCSFTVSSWQQLDGGAWRWPLPWPKSPSWRARAGSAGWTGSLSLPWPSRFSFLPEFF